MGFVEHRRAPRTTVDVEARLSIPGQGACQGIIVNLSFTGNLFLPERPLEIPPGGGAHMLFTMPSSRAWLEPLVQVRRAADLTLPSGQVAQAIGFEFLGLSMEEERAIGSGCVEWADHTRREYPLSARCYLRGLGSLPHFSRYGRLISGGRDRLRVNLAAPLRLDAGAQLEVKVHSAAMTATVEASPDAHQLELRLGREWGRDFLLHEARRQSLQ